MMMTKSPQSAWGGVLRLQLAPQQVGGGGSGLAQRLASSIEDVPLRTMFPLLAIKVDIGETSIFFLI